MSREQAEAKLKIAIDTAKALEDLLEIERLTRPSLGQYNASAVRELKAQIEKAAIEQQVAQRRLDQLTNVTPGDV